MWPKIIEFVLSVALPKADDGTFKYGARHTSVAAMVLGVTLIYGLNKFYVTRLEAVQNSAMTASSIQELKADQERTKLFVFREVQKANNHWTEVKSRLDDLKGHLIKIEQKKEMAILKDNLDKKWGSDDSSESKN